ncbi:hypothetical protein PNOK_0260800 [Pyrrhoderma noxium]|uniref:Uncharacterized protein n=1 Tax=Pyrrhoderma noxium TaxID=2282107 RepID=A0A286USU5_9AGAM|nr:hypothetical protein PNOK_0260800 [Pyrrhoderma noxium]
MMAALGEKHKLSYILNPIDIFPCMKNFIWGVARTTPFHPSVYFERRGPRPAESNVRETDLKHSEDYRKLSEAVSKCRIGCEQDLHVR